MRIYTHLLDSFLLAQSTRTDRGKLAENGLKWMGEIDKGNVNVKGDMLFLTGKWDDTTVNKPGN